MGGCVLGEEKDSWSHKCGIDGGNNGTSKRMFYNRNAGEIDCTTTATRKEKNENEDSSQSPLFKFGVERKTEVTPWS
jgi:hypothetical protein